MTFVIKCVKLHNRADAAHSAAKKGCKSILEWIAKTDCVYNTKTCAIAALHGHFELVLWCKNNGCGWIYDACGWRDLPDVYCELDAWDVCASAATGGYIDIMKWCLENGYVWQENTMWCCKARKLGNHKGVLFIFKKNFSCTHTL